jgi:hypothetical protein
MEQDSHCTHNVTLRRVRVTLVGYGKAISITYFECVSVAVVIQHAKRVRRIILSHVTCPALLYFSTLSHKRHYVRKKIGDHKMFLSFSTAFA